jgi:hypothetical protein
MEEGAMSKPRLKWEDHGAILVCCDEHNWVRGLMWWDSPYRGVAPIGTGVPVAEIQPRADERGMKRAIEKRVREALKVAEKIERVS